MARTFEVKFIITSALSSRSDEQTVKTRGDALVAGLGTAEADYQTRERDGAISLMSVITYTAPTRAAAAAAMATVDTGVGQLPGSSKVEYRYVERDTD